MTKRIAEAATEKNRAKRMIRDAQELLKGKSIPDDMKTALESVSAALKKTWGDLDTDKKMGAGRKGVNAESDLTEGEMEETYGSDEKPWIPWNVMSFTDLDAIEATEEIAEQIKERTNQFTGIVHNIMWASNEVIPDKIGALTTLFDEFTLILGSTLAGDDMGESGAKVIPDAPTPTVPVPEPIEEVAKFAESLLSGAVITLDPEMAEVEGDVKPFEVSVQIIKPGWGNTRDNHYYPREMLRRDAKKFEGAKMYETDHRDAEKSTRTWVSTVKEISGFTDDGAPIARVVVHDPGFVERLRNLNQANMLDKMECSILASGAAKNGFELDGRKGRVVESITDVSAVDWVTRAGAGGKVLSIAESEDGAGNTDNTTDTDSDAAGDVPAVDGVPAEEVPVAGDPTPTTESQPTTPAYLSEAEVAPLLAKLAKPVAQRVRMGQYASIAEVTQAIETEIAYLKSVTGSGSVALMGETKAVRHDIRPTQVAESILAVNKKFGF